ncbi:cyclic AMP-dependent transcription factor ATF-1-like isoform X4 [Centruroides sculpturatus]|uniref:cyclic AMP-dependent transcription factor ATF-1-like isoform X4 n=1 Tax=Centruroides sculpturatus TaxID=218467 RepID=UPI000C6C8F18|nr:cyclic AMP-dependent transcription factor ATF-1-like isoform X4 [Centruroides sculpturatus]
MCIYAIYIGEKVLVLLDGSSQKNLGHLAAHMERLSENQNSGSSLTSQNNDKTPASSATVVVTPGNGQTEIRTSSATGRTNGTVLFTSPTNIKHVVTSSSPTTQAIAVPQTGGSVSIVHVAIPSQPVQSVIQPSPNQHSVIQAPSGTTVQSVQLSKNVILLNKIGGQGSVIQSTEGENNVHPVQLIQTTKEDNDSDGIVASYISSEESRKRREILARRPSYRKILSELSSAETQGAVASLTNDVKEETTTTSGSETSSQESDTGNTIVVGNTRYHTAAGLLKVVPASAIQLSTGTQEGGLSNLQTLNLQTMTNSTSGTTGTIVQYAAQGQDGQFFVPVTVSAADLQAYQIRTGSTASGLPQGVVMSSSSNIQSQHQIAEEASRKRELRLLKNREAAKECRRKKKEYIKCLENRVAVLENQNKALIDELKSLKELYCQKTD